MTNIPLKKKILLAVSLSFVTASFPVFAQPSSANSINAAVVQNATAEWTFFGGKKEGDNGYWQRVVKYWQEGNTGRLDINNRSAVVSANNPWSAAFVSYIMARSGAGSQFKYSGLHYDYIVDSIRKRKEGNTTAPFVGYELSEASPVVGDLVCASRLPDAGLVRYDNALIYRNSESQKNFKSHCDIVVATRTGSVDVIGGNVNDSVTKTTITLVNSRVPRSGNRFVLIRNNASAPLAPTAASPVLDPDFYLMLYADIRNALGAQNYAGAVQHWLNRGILERRASSPAFDVRYYLARHPDLQNAFGANYSDAAIQHWLNRGILEGRASSPVFDVRYYLARYPDLQNAFGANYSAAIQHWLNRGILEGRRGSANFDPAFYLRNNPDVAAAYGATNYRWAILHWLIDGKNKGRRGVP